MMKRLICSFQISTFVFLLSTFSVFAQDSTPENSWEKFPEGAWAIVKSVQKKGDRTQESSYRYKRISDTEGKWNVNREKRDPNSGEWKDLGPTGQLSGTTPKELDLAVVGTRKEDVEINGKGYTCTVTEYSNDDGSKSITFWKCQNVTVPFRTLPAHGPDFALGSHVLKAEVRLDGKRGKQEVTIKVVDLEHSIEVDGTSVVCVKEEGQIYQEVGGKKIEATMERTNSSNVPGHLVYRMTRGKINGDEVLEEQRLIKFSRQ